MSQNNKIVIDTWDYVTYNSHITTKEVNTMARKKKSGNKDNTLQAIVLITAILNLVKAVIDLIIRLTE